MSNLATVILNANLVLAGIDVFCTTVFLLWPHEDDKARSVLLLVPWLVMCISVAVISGRHWAAVGVFSIDAILNAWWFLRLRRGRS